MKALHVLAAALLIPAAGGCSDGTEPAGQEPEGQVMDGDAASGWKTIEYDGIRVDVPVSWVRSEMDDCPVEFEHWAAPDSMSCGAGGGVSFFVARTLETEHGPGVRQADEFDSAGVNGIAWAGHVLAGEWAVYVNDAEQDVVRGVLNSVE